MTLYAKPRIALAAAVALATLCGAHTARAQVDCDTLSNAVYAPGTTDIKPYLSRIAGKLASAPAADQITIVYQAVGSCTALDAVLNDTDLQGTAVFWTGNTNPDGTPEELSCTIPANTKADLAFSDVAAKTCTGTDLPSGIDEHKSFIQGFGFVVPPNSNQQAITATEAYFLLKFGGETGKQVPPWTEPASVVIRNPASSTQLLIGLASGIPGTKWSANLTNDAGGSGNVIKLVAAENTTGNAEKTIGILSLQRYDGARDKVRMLAFEAFGQQCLGAVYPDSTATSFDKQNVRDGHYDIWGYEWTIAKSDSSGQPQKPLVKKLVDFIAGTMPINGADPIADAIKAGAVPACAMAVERDYDGGPLKSFMHPDPCTCLFEQVATGKTSCQACQPSDTCPNGGVCRHGYCEAR